MGNRTSLAVLCFSLQSPPLADRYHFGVPSLALNSFAARNDPRLAVREASIGRVA